MVCNPPVLGAPGVSSDAWLLYLTDVCRLHTSSNGVNHALNIRKLYFLDNSNASVPYGSVHSARPECPYVEIPGL